MKYFRQCLQASDVTIVEKYRSTISIMALVSWISLSKSSQSNLVDIKLMMSTLVSLGLLLPFEPWQ